MKIQKPSRDEYRRTLNIVKDELEVEFNTRNLPSYESCKKALKQMIFKYFLKIADNPADLVLALQQFEYVQALERENEELREHGRQLLEENDELRRELKSKKKWWQIWR